MRLVRLTARVTPDRTVTLKVPEDVPMGLTEIVVVFGPPESRPGLGNTLGDLQASEFFGMWRGREDIPDSSTFARALREGTWTRSGQ